MTERAGKSLETKDSPEDGTLTWPAVDSVVDLADPEVELLIPKDDVSDPEVSIVIPAVNEELTISDFVDWCRQGSRRRAPEARSSSSTAPPTGPPSSRSARGARVLQHAQARPRPGLHRRHPVIRGRYVVMGDADCTYDFRQLAPFVEKLARGLRVCHGVAMARVNRAGAMPALHRYLGTPVTTWILNRLYGSRFTDIHCGMRGHLPRRARPHGPRVAVLGVRVGDGAQVGPHGAPDRPRCPSPSTRTGRAASPPQALRMVLPVPSGLDQPPRHVRLPAPTSSS